VVSEKIKKKSANQKQELPVAPMFVNGQGILVSDWPIFKNLLRNRLAK
jgi:hypothetical protein